MKHLRKFVALVIVLIVFSFLMLSGPRASVTGAITGPSGSTAFKDTTLNLEAQLTAHGWDIMNTSVENVLFKIYVPFPIMSNVTINSSDITLSGSTGYTYYNNTTSVYAYCYGYIHSLLAQTSYSAYYTGDYIFYAEINYTHVDDYGNLENATYRDSKVITVSEAPDVITEVAGSSGIPGTNLAAETKNETTTQALGVGESTSVKINHVYHIITVLELKNNYVTLEIQSETLTVKVSTGETKEIDVDGDGVIDLTIYLKGVSNGKAYLTFTVIVPKVVSAPEPVISEPVVSEPVVVAPVEQPAAQTNTVPLGTGIITIVTMAIIAVVSYVIIKKNKKRRGR